MRGRVRRLTKTSNKTPYKQIQIENEWPSLFLPVSETFKRARLQSYIQMFLHIYFVKIFVWLKLLLGLTTLRVTKHQDSSYCKVYINWGLGRDWIPSLAQLWLRWLQLARLMKLWRRGRTTASAYIWIYHHNHNIHTLSRQYCSMLNFLYCVLQLHFMSNVKFGFDE